MTRKLIILLLTLGLTLAASSWATGETGRMLELEGKVSAYNVEQGLLTVRDKERVKHTFAIDWQTELVGFQGLGELEKRDELKIWYQGTAEPQAVKVEKKLEVGCG